MYYRNTSTGEIVNERELCRDWAWDAKRHEISFDKWLSNEGWEKTSIVF